MTDDSRYRELAPYYDIFIDWDKRLAREIPFVLKAASARVKTCLDLGCGTGRHLAALRGEGLAVEGCEPSPGLRKLARKNLPAVKIHPHRMERLARLAARYGPWDLVLCLGNTLAHLAADRLPPFFYGLRKAISANGLAIIHVLSYDRIMRNRPAALPQKEILKRGVHYGFERFYEYKPDKIRFRIEIRKNGVLLGIEKQILYPVYSAALARAARAAGLTAIGLYGGFDTGSPFTADSENLVAVIGR